MPKRKQIDFFDRIMDIRVGSHTCFLCGCRLNKNNRTDEHVIPQWVLRKCQLSNEQLQLINNTRIPYKQLKIPCCFTFNIRHLQPLEKRMSRAIESGAKAVRKLDNKDIFIWIGKIIYGLLYKDVFLSWNRRSGTNVKIMDKNIIKHYKMHHFFLQSARIPINFDGFFPASILIVDIQEPKDPKFGWDFHDELRTLSVACRIGKVGIITVLQDGGAQQNYFPFLKLSNRKLHPLQFKEAFAKVAYHATLLNRVPKYIIIDGTPINVMQAPLQGLSNKPIFDRGNAEHYAMVLSTITGFPMSNLFLPPNSIMSWLYNSDGTAKSMPLRKYPI